jgi:hypothetical protein
VIDAVSIDPTAIYDDGALYCALGITSAALSKARRSGLLRFSQKGRRILYVGQWIIDWINADGQGPQEAGRAAS